jgi:two-component system sensor histidine kinase/response regulator
VNDTSKRLPLWRGNGRSPHLIRGRYVFKDLLDLNSLTELFESFSRFSGYTTGLMSYPDREILLGTGWRTLCREFHSVDTEASKCCQESNCILVKALTDGERIAVHSCGHGLVNGATPIIVDGVHAGNLFTGQLLFSSPDLKRFEEQAMRYGFDREKYLQAVREVPIVREEDFREMLWFLGEIAKRMAEQALEKIDSIEKSVRLEESARKQQKILESLPAGVVFVDADTKRVLDVNPYALKLMGGSREEIEGRACFKHFSSEKNEDLACSSEELYHVEQILAAGENEEIPILRNRSHVSIDGKDFIIESFVDISEQKSAEKEAQLQASLLNSLLDSIPDLVFFKDTAGVYLGCNPEFCAFVGRKREEIVGSTDFDLFAREVAEFFREKDQQILEGLQRRQNEEWVTYPDGRKILLDTLKTPYWGPNGELLGILGVSRDITDRKRAEEKQRRLAEEANAANEAKGAFLANMSHEIRTPMNGILGMTELLLETELSEAQLELAGTVKSSADSLLAIINDILDYSKIEAGKVELLPESFELKEIVEALERTLRFRMEQRSIEYITEISPDVPPFLHGDPLRLRQVLLNLIGNAVKFTSPGGVVTLLISSLQQTENTTLLQFSIVDSGIGISPDSQEIIFEAFSQGDPSTTRKFGGTGLGLSISQQLVELMGGELGVSSREGVGSNFHFTAKFGICKRSDVLVTDGDDGAVDEESFVKNLRVLLVEDNPINQKLAVRFLEKAGHSAVLAKNGKEAVDLFQAEELDLILMDIQMPVMSGEEALHIIRQRDGGGTIPIVALTAHAMSTDRDKYLSEGFDGYLAKPFNKNDLLSLLTEMVSSRKS